MRNSLKLSRVCGRQVLRLRQQCAMPDCDKMPARSRPEPLPAVRHVRAGSRKGHLFAMPSRNGVVSARVIERFVCPVARTRPVQGRTRLHATRATSNVAGASECTACSAGHYSASPGSALCNSCQPGSTSRIQGRQAASSAAGQYSPEVKPRCTTCSAGSCSIWLPPHCKTVRKRSYSARVQPRVRSAPAVGSTNMFQAAGVKIRATPSKARAETVPRVPTRGTQNMFEEGCACLVLRVSAIWSQKRLGSSFASPVNGKYSAAGQNECQEVSVGNGKHSSAGVGPGESRVVCAMFRGHFFAH